MPELPTPEPAEVLRLLGPNAVLSHEEAARYHGIPLVGDTGTRRVTVPRNHSGRRVPGWQVARADVPVVHRVVAPDGRVLTGMLRTVLDLSRVLPTAHAVAAADHTIAKGLLAITVLTLHLGSARGRGAAALRTGGGLVEAGAGSVMESLVRVLLVQAGLPRPRSQYQVCERDGTLIAKVDFAWVAERLVLECDGFAFHSDREAYRRDRQRMNELERHGWRVLRVTWEDVVGRPDYIVALVRECLAVNA